MGKGTLIVLEGPEGVGKSTAHKALGEGLREAGVQDLTILREPGGTPAGQAIRGILLDSDDLPDYAELLLMLASRAILVEQVVKPALARGGVVLLDRYELSTIAYQGVGRGIGVSTVLQLSRQTTGGLTPDVTFVLNASEEVRRGRLVSRGGKADRIEEAGLDFHRAVANAYAEAALYYPSIVPVDAERPVEDVVKTLMDTSLALIRERGITPPSPIRARKVSRV